MTTPRDFSNNGPGSSGSRPLQSDDKAKPTLSEAESATYARETGEMTHDGPRDPTPDSERGVDEALMESYNG